MFRLDGVTYERLTHFTDQTGSIKRNHVHHDIFYVVFVATQECDSRFTGYVSVLFR